MVYWLMIKVELYHESFSPRKPLCKFESNVLDFRSSSFPSSPELYLIFSAPLLAKLPYLFMLFILQLGYMAGSMGKLMNE